MQDLEVFLKERMEESNIVFDNITIASIPQKDEKELEKEIELIKAERAKYLRQQGSLRRGLSGRFAIFNDDFADRL